MSELTRGWSWWCETSVVLREEWKRLLRVEWMTMKVFVNGKLKNYLYYWFYVKVGFILEICFSREQFIVYLGMKFRSINYRHTKLQVIRQCNRCTGVLRRTVLDTRSRIDTVEVFNQ